MSYPDEKIKQIIGGATVSSSDFTENIPATTSAVGVFSYAEGYPEETATPLESGGKPPRRQDENGILRLFSKWLYWFQSGGYAKYDSLLDYEVGATVWHEGEQYWCIQANGASSTVAAPSNTNYWKPFTRNITLTGAVSGTATISKNDTTITTTASYSTPAGTVIAYAGGNGTITTPSANAPTGWLWCNGGAVSRTSFPALFSAIGTTYGTGDGSTTFNVPNLMDNRFIEGVSSTVGVANNAGLPDIQGTLPVQTHKWNDETIQTNVTGAFHSGSTYPGLGDHSWGSYWFRKAEFQASRYNQIYGASNTVQPKSLCMRYLIKY